MFIPHCLARLMGCAPYRQNFSHLRIPSTSHHFSASSRLYLCTLPKPFWLSHDAHLYVSLIPCTTFRFSAVPMSHYRYTRATDARTYPTHAGSKLPCILSVHPHISEPFHCSPLRSTIPAYAARCSITLSLTPALRSTPPFVDVRKLPCA
jgi:hypothetical protein